MIRRGFSWVHRAVRFENIPHIPDALHDGGIAPEPMRIRQAQDGVVRGPIELRQNLDGRDDRSRRDFAQQARGLLFACVVESKETPNRVPEHERRIFALDGRLNQPQAALRVRSADVDNRRGNAARP